MTEPTRSPPNLPSEGAAFVKTGGVLSQLEETLGRCLSPLGLTRNEASTVKGSFVGTVGGRTVYLNSIVRSRTRYTMADIRYRSYEGFAIELIAEPKVQTRLALAAPPRGSDDNVVVKLVVYAIHRWNKLETLPLSANDSQFAGLRARVFDPAWASSCLEDPAIREALDGLGVRASKTPEGDVQSSSWSYGPGRMSIVISPSVEAITPDQTKQWLDHFVRLLELSEAKPTTRIAKLSKLEQTLKNNPKALVPLVILAMVGIPLALMLGLAVFLAVGYAIMGEAVLIFPILFLFFFMPYAMFLVFRDWYRKAKRALPTSKRS